MQLVTLTDIEITVSSERHKIVSWFLEEFERFNVDKWTYKLLEACTDGDVDKVKSLLEDGANANSVFGSSLCTPLHCACGERGSAAMVKVLLDAGADATATKTSKDTPLHFACLFAQVDTVNLLLAAGADVNAKNKRGITPLYWACSPAYGHFCADVVKLLLEAGADVNVRDVDGDTPLHFACERGFSDVVKMLIDAGSDVNAKDEEGRTPLNIARKRGHGAIVEILLQAGVKE